MNILWLLQVSLLYLFAIINNHNVYNSITKKHNINETTCMKPFKVNYLHTLHDKLPYTKLTSQIFYYQGQQVLGKGKYHIYIYYIYIYVVFATDRLFEVAIESWPEGDLNPQPLNFVFSFCKSNNYSLKSAQHKSVIILCDKHCIQFCYSFQKNV